MAGPNFWENDPVAQPASAPVAGAGAPLYTRPKTPAPQTELQQRKDAIDVARGEADLAGAGTDRTQKRLDSVMKLRSAYESAPVVKEYRVGIQSLSAALRRSPDATGDTSLIYDYAKAMDPGSVVREAEMGMAQGGASIIDAKVADLKKQLGIEGGGVLPPEVRERLRREIANKVTSMNVAYSEQRKRYADDARRYGFDPAEITGNHDGDPFIDQMREYQNRNTPADSSVRPSYGEVQFGGDAPQDPLTPEQQAAYDAFWKVNPNATAEQLQAFGQSIGVNINNAAEIIAARDKGAGVQPGSSAVSGLTPQEKSELDAKMKNTGQGGSFAAGVGDSVSVGFIDEAGSALEAFGGAMSGEGAFGDLYDSRHRVNRAYLDGLQDRDPWTYAGGQITGGLVLPTFAARTPAELAKVGAAYGAAYGVGSGDTMGERLGGGIVGAVTGGAVGWGGGKLLQRLEGKPLEKAAEVGPDAAKEAADTAASRYAKAQQFGLEPGLDAVGGRGSKIVGQTLSNMPGSAGVMNKARQKLAEQTVNAVDDVAATYGPTTSFQGMGSALKRGSEKWVSRFEEVSGKLYSRIPISDQAPAQLGNTRQALTELTSIFDNNPKMAEAWKNTRLDKFMDALAEEGPGLTWKELKAFRSRIGEEIGDARFSDKIPKTELRRLYGALSEDMKATAQSQGPAALKAFERANTIYREGQQRIDNALADILGDDGAMTVERAAARVQAMVKDGKAGSDFQKIAAIRRSLPKEEAGEVVNGIIRLMGQPANAEGRGFAADTFIRNYESMAPAAKNLLFGGENKELRQNLDEFVGVVRNLAERDALRNNSNSAGQIIFGTTLGFASWPTLITQAATSYGAARLMTNPKFVRWATGYSKMLRGAAKAGAEPSEAAKQTQVRLLDKLAASEPALAQDILPLKDAILNAANDNVARPLAASTGDKEQQAQQR